MKKIVLYIFLVIMASRPVVAILDGRIQPIYIDGGYTFTNYEWARGEVHFRDGFSVPPQTTAILGITSPTVRGLIVLDNGDADGALDAVSPARILLETPLTIHNPIIYGGGEIGSIDGLEGRLNFIGFAGNISDRLTFITDMAINFGGMRVNFSGPTGGPTKRPSLMINASTPKKLRLINGLFDIDDSTPRFIAGDVVGGRHALLLENFTMRFTTTMSFTNLDVVCKRGKTTFFGGDRGSVQFYSGLKICNEASLAGSLGLEFLLTPSTVSNDYFQIEPRGQLLLNNNSLLFNRPLKIPFPVPAENTYSRIVVDGLSTIKGIGVGTNNTLQLGAGPAATYTCDSIIDVRYGGRLLFDNVIVRNKNLGH
ncbi:hypothetical protein FJ365_02130 [Candidatus Dependentiae bacterium]|nr:hypothetical protein [Candidatus Dependentiae bacterium]